MSTARHDEFLTEQRAKARESLAGQKRQFDNEIRVCKRCGWKADKQTCIANAIKVCPRCGGDEVGAMSQDYSMDPKSVRAQLKQGTR